MKNRVFLWHLLFWIVYMSIFTFIEGGYANQFREAFLIEVAYFPIRLAVIYLNYFWLMPKFLLNDKTRQYVILTILSILIASFLHRLLMFSFINELIFPGWDQGSFWQGYKFLRAGMIITSPMIFLIGLTVIYRLVDSQKKLAEISEERTKTELQYLKNQINPHFFFNTLNSLYGLALKKSDQTPNVVMKLSELMSYMLYDTDQTGVALSKEINYIKNYIELEEVRFEGRFKCNLQVDGDIDNLLIPPMILLPFVENAFKHGVNTSSEGAWINVLIRGGKKELMFEVENSIGKSSEEEKKGGLGIQNVVRRLQLLFEDNYSLNYGRSGQKYSVQLTIQL
ncbi:MAG: histidine kinase [Cyclobacteriaceae bacterium]